MVTETRFFVRGWERERKTNCIIRHDRIVWIPDRFRGCSASGFGLSPSAQRSRRHYRRQADTFGWLQPEWQMDDAD